MYAQQKEDRDSFEKEDNLLEIIYHNNCRDVEMKI